MNGDVQSQKQKIDAVLQFANQLPQDDVILSHWAKYVCVLTSGFIEDSLRKILIKYTRDKATPQVVNFAESKLEKITNLNEEKIAQLLGAFSANWMEQFRSKRTEEQKDAIDSVIANRHQIVHGQSVGLTLARMKKYYEEVAKVITIICDECVK